MKTLIALTLMIASPALAHDVNPETELAQIAEQKLIKPLVERICEQVPYLDTGYTEQKCVTVTIKGNTKL